MIINICKTDILTLPNVMSPIGSICGYMARLGPRIKATMFDMMMDIPIALIRAFIRAVPPRFADFMLPFTSHATSAIKAKRPISTDGELKKSIKEFLDKNATINMSTTAKAVNIMLRGFDSRNGR